MPVTINNVRLSYANLFQPKPPYNNPAGAPKYSVTILVPKSNTAAKLMIDQEIAQAIEGGVSSKWGGVRPPQPAICVHDGDQPRPSDGAAYGEECRGCWVFTASSTQAPFVVDGQVQPIIDPTQVYSGMWANVSVNFFAYNQAGKKGIGCGLNGVQKLRDDTPLSSRVTAQEAFQPENPGPAASAYPASQPSAYPAPQAPAYPVSQPAAYPAPAGYPMPAVDPITGLPIPRGGYNPSGFPVMGV